MDYLSGVELYKFLFTLEINPLSDVSLADMFSHSGFPFHFVDGFSCSAEASCLSIFEMNALHYLEFIMLEYMAMSKIFCVNISKEKVNMWDYAA